MSEPSEPKENLEEYGDSTEASPPPDDDGTDYGDAPAPGTESGAPDAEVAPPVPEPPPPPRDIGPRPRSLSAVLWDLLPERLRGALVEQGVYAPAGARSAVVDNAGLRGGMILGPPSAGKTTLIAAMEQACAYRPVDDPYDLLWRAAGDEDTRQAMGDLLRQAVDQVLSPRSVQRATDTVKRYAFAIEGKRAVDGWHAQSVFNLELGFHDGPGGAMFGDDTVWEQKAAQREHMVKDTVGAGLLVFCFDSSTRELSMLSKRMPQVLAQIAQPEPGGDRYGGYYGGHLRQDRRLDARRVLVLMNKIDVLCQRFADEAALGTSADDGTAPPTARELAERLDPVAQAIEAIGIPTLRRIRAAMYPDADLAVGICSTWGFHSDGHALFNERGEPILVDWVSENNVLSQWRPYGVREALVFLASGRASRTVRIVQPDDLEDRMVPETDVRV